MRDLDSGAVSELAKRAVVVSGALRLSLSPVRRFWGGRGTLSIDGEDYLGVGARALVSPVTSEIGGAAKGVTITLSGLDPDIAATIEDEDYSQKPAVLTRLVFDSNGVNLLGAMVVMRGRLDRVVLRETANGEAALDFMLENSGRDLSRRGSAMRNDVWQRILGGATDGGMKHVGTAADATLYWGKRPDNAPLRPGPNRAAGGAGGNAGGGRFYRGREW